MLYITVGGIGNGKTLFLTYLALLHYLNGYRIISNYTLKIPHEKISGLEDIQKILKELKKNPSTTPIFFAFDEGWIFTDSRKGMSKNNISWSHFFMQTRKVGFDVAISSQDLGQVDKRIRKVTDRVYVTSIILREDENDNKSKPIILKIKCIAKEELGVYIHYKDYYLTITDDLLNLYNTLELINI